MTVHQRLWTLVGGSLLLGGCPEPTTPGDTLALSSSSGDEDVTTTTEAPPVTGSTTDPGATTGPMPMTEATTEVDTTGGTTMNDLPGSSTGDTTTDDLSGTSTGGSTMDDPSGSSTIDDTASTGDTSGGSDSTTTGAPGGCGDGIVDGREQCDAGGPSAECDVDCTPAECGDGLVNADAGELCDDANALGGDGCTPTCQPNAKIEQLALGFLHTCASLADGTMRCWGSNLAGQLGLGHTQDLGGVPGQMPTPEVDLGGSVMRASVHANSGCVVLDTGKVRCWGAGSYGMLGYGNKKTLGDAPGEMPTPDVEVGAPARDVSVGGVFTCAVTQADNVRCWGYNAGGQLGYGHTNTLGDEPGEMPTPDLDLGGPVEKVVTGDRHSCAILKDGTLRCWGGNSMGELGYGDTNARGDEPGEMPPPPVALGGEVAEVAIAESFFYTCALLKSGTVHCWGENKYYTLGTGVFSGSPVGDEPGEMPPPAVPLAGKAVALSAGANHVCALLESGEMQCWGSNGYGALGSPGQSSLVVPTVVDLGGPVAQIASGNSHRCALLVDGKLRCWGSGKFGRLGTGSEQNIGDDETPVSVPPIEY